MLKFFKENSNCEVTIMVDENSDIQFLSIIKIMQRMNVTISQNMLKNIEVFIKMIEELIYMYICYLLECK